MDIWALVYGESKDHYTGRIYHGHSVPDNAMHVCDTPTEAVMLWALHHTYQPCPRCSGPLVMFRRRGYDSRAIADIAEGWLRDPSHDILRARGDVLWQEMTRLFDMAQRIATLEE